MDASNIVDFIIIAAKIIFVVCILTLIPDIIVALARQTKKYHWAVFACNCKLKFAPTSALTYANRGWAFLNLKEYQRALSDCDQAIALKPKLAIAYVNRSVAFLNLKEYQRALSDCDQAIALNRSLDAAYVTRSWAYLELKEYQRALSDCDQAINLNPRLASAYNNRGYAYFRTREYQRALQDFDRALALNPLMSKASSNRIYVYFAMGEYQLALAECERLIQDGSAEQRQSAYINQALIYSHQRKCQQALQDLEQAIILDPDNALAYNNRGHAYYYLKEYQHALADCDKAIALKPEYGTFYETRAMVYLGLNQLEQAQSDLQKACALDPGFIIHGWRNEYLAMCLHGASLEAAQHLEALAQTDLTTAFLFAPQDHAVHICRGVAHWLRGDFEQALTELEQAILLNAYNEDTYFWVGMACVSLGQDDEAHKALQRALELGLLSIFLTPLRWLEPQRPDFYTRYAVPLLNGSTDL